MREFLEDQKLAILVLVQFLLHRFQKFRYIFARLLESFKAVISFCGKLKEKRRRKKEKKEDG